jgi:hypothetical protein
MPLILVLKPFKFAHSGYRVQEFEPKAEPVETTDECAAIAIENKWAKKVKPRSAPADTEAQAAALRQAIAGLEQQHADATDDATKAALAAELAAKQAELAELG